MYTASLQLFKHGLVAFLNTRTNRTFPFFIIDYRNTSYLNLKCQTRKSSQRNQSQFQSFATKPRSSFSANVSKVSVVQQTDIKSTESKEQYRKSLKTSEVFTFNVYRLDQVV